MPWSKESIQKVGIGNWLGSQARAFAPRMRHMRRLNRSLTVSKENCMSENVQSINYSAGALGSAERNKVLRNTYWLLALSLLPTVLGAWLGVATGITRSLTGGLGLIVFLGGAFGFLYAIEKTKNSSAGVPILLAFTFFMGLMLSSLIARVLGFKNGPSLIMTAFGGTAGIFFVMATVASTIKRDISGMGKWLFVGALVIMVGGIINVFVGSTMGMAVISMMAMAVFSAYMLYDLKQIMDGGETNYISATLALYLDIFNVFQSLLALLGIFGGDRD
jgi:modulator of FtsH protease